MRRFILLILALATLLPSLAQAYDVLILQSRRDPAYEAVVKGFHSGNNPSERTIVLSDYAEVDVVRIVREDRPRVVLAVGDAALNAARQIRQIPVVAVMAIGIHNIKGSHYNLTGVGMFAQPESYIKIFKAMKTKRIGVIHNPAKSGWYLHLARRAAEDAGLELVVREISSPRETIESLSNLTGKVDSLWMLPDTTAVTRETTEAYFRFGQQNAVPVVSFAANYLGLGAAAVVELDWATIGHQADTMVARIMSGNGTNEAAPRFPASTQVKTNSSVLKRLNSPL